ncbi:MAG: hypothetical protein JWO20_3222 [Candidatus Angelobacter sp.]|jgi:hypothetical protein|nr:hypothetical protein [Candidatus Angelobacter sp.]
MKWRRWVKDLRQKTATDCTDLTDMHGKCRVASSGLSGFTYFASNSGLFKGMLPRLALPRNGR